MRPKHELGELIREQWPRIEASTRLTSHHKRMLKALAQCRTAALGGHLDACSDCGAVRISYNSCRNRHCPKCQGAQREAWIRAREEHLLPVPYFHLVFTLPDALNPLAIKHPKLIYGVLFRAAWQTMQTFAKDHKHLGAEAAMVAILHTWGQTLSLHPHLHCIVPGGGLTKMGKWKQARNKGKFLFPVKAMSQVFRAKFVAGLRQLRQAGKMAYTAGAALLADETAWRELLHPLFQKPWVIYAKRPFAGPEQVIRYLGRYTHRIALANHRLRRIEGGQVSFTWKDYRKGSKKGIITLKASEFLRRFCLHILPPGFTRLRHYGILASRNKTQALTQARDSLGVQAPPKPQPQTWQEKLQEVNGLDLGQCPGCKKGRMKPLRGITPNARSPPATTLPTRRRRTST